MENSPVFKSEKEVLDKQVPTYTCKADKVNRYILVHRYIIINK